jgi:hypothetical protein
MSLDPVPPITHCPKSQSEVMAHSSLHEPVNPRTPAQPSDSIQYHSQTYRDAVRNHRLTAPICLGRGPVGQSKARQGGAGGQCNNLCCARPALGPRRGRPEVLLIADQFRLDSKFAGKGVQTSALSPMPLLMPWLWLWLWHLTRIEGGMRACLLRREGRSGVVAPYSPRLGATR